VISLGPFDLKFALGRGGMGVVWAGMHRVQQVPVAVKFLTVGKTASLRAAFRNEVRAVAGLDHPHIVMVYDFGEVDEAVERASEGAFTKGTPYLAMELADRGSLNRVRGRMRWYQVREVLLSLLDGLAHAHARGVIHRDIKPGNVLIGEGRAGVKLTDFGLAHAVEREIEQRVNEDFRAGTPAYMAPEQFHGSWRDYGPWTDLYALGCLTYSVVTGRPPFDSRDPHETMRLHLSGAVPPLRAPMAVADGFEEWLRRLLRKDPAHRFQRAADAAWALEQLGSPTPDARSQLEKSLTLDDETLLGEPTRTTLYHLDLDVEAEPVFLESEGTASSGLSPLGSLPRAMRPVVPPIPRDWGRALGVPHGERLHGAGLGLLELRRFKLVGRREERDALWDALRRCQVELTPRVLVLRGPAGCGKTALADWFVERAHEVGAATVFRATHGPGDRADDGLRRLLTGWSRCEGMDRAAVAARVEQLCGEQGVEDSDESRALTELIAPAPDRDVAAVQFAGAVERYVLVRRLFERVAFERPVVVALDDVHHGLDALSFVIHLLHDAPDRVLPVVFVLTVRDEELEPGSLESTQLDAILERPMAQQIDVGPLPEEDRPALVREILGLDGRLAAEVEQRTVGNPGFAVQLVRGWVRRGILIGGPGGFRLQEGAAVSMPEDVDGVWKERVDRLLEERPEADGLALELAAVLGQDVDTAEWRATCELAAVDAPLSLVEELLSERLVTTGPMGPEIGFAFIQAMLRERLVQRADERGRRRSHHRHCARMLAARDELPERLALHLVGAGELESAVGPLLEAARWRMARGEGRRAEVLLEHREMALETLALAEADARWGMGWAARSECARTIGDTEGGEVWANRAVAGARAHGWDEVRAQGLRLLGRFAASRGEPTRAWRKLRQAERLAEAKGFRATVSACRRDLASVLVGRGSLARGETMYLSAFEEAELDGDAASAGAACEGLFEVCRQAGRYDEARRWIERAGERFEQTGSRIGVAGVANDLGDLCRLEGDLGGAEEGYREGLRRMEALAPSQAAIVRTNLALVLIERGRPREARPLLERSLRAFVRQDRRPMIGAVHACLLPSLAAEGDWDGWDLHMERAAAVLEETGVVDVDIARMARIGGELAIGLGEAARGRHALTLALVQLQALNRRDEARQVRIRLQGTSDESGSEIDPTDVP
jgi:serine/threonine protein kinase/tetratricopeptide (TPR) repeat protein